MPFEEAKLPKVESPVKDWACWGSRKLVAPGLKVEKSDAPVYC